MKPRVLSRPHARYRLRLFNLLSGHADGSSLPYYEGVMIFAFSFIRNKLIFFMFPDKFLDIQGSRAKNKSPAVSAVFVIEAVMNDIETGSREIETNGQKAFKFWGFELGI